MPSPKNETSGSDPIVSFHISRVTAKRAGVVRPLGDVLVCGQHPVITSCSPCPIALPPRSHVFLSPFPFLVGRSS